MYDEKDFFRIIVTHLILMGFLDNIVHDFPQINLDVPIRKLTIETNDGIFEGKIQLWVHDVEDVKTICNNLKKIQNIKQVNRVEE